MPLPPVPTFQPIAQPAAVVVAGDVRFTVLTSRLIRLEHSKGGRFEDRPSQVFWHRDLPAPEARVTVTDATAEIETEHLRLKHRRGGRGFTSRSLAITLKQTGVTWKYGARAKDNLKGTARTLDGAFGVVRLEDGLISRSGWAVIDDSESLVFNPEGWLEPRGADGQDLYFFGYGKDYAACLQDFTRVAGAIPMIPRYILGNWWSRYWEYTQDDLTALMEEFRSHDVPLSVCIVDMDWHVTKTGNKSDGWTGYTWNRELFPDPEGFIAELHRQGLRTALNLHPAAGVWPHEGQYESLARWMGADPASDKPIPFDVANPRFMEGYFDLLHHPFEDAGVDFWWLDWQQGKKSKVAGLDPLYLLNHLHYFDLGRDGRKRPFVFSRWGGLGNHRYPIGFSGDTYVRWSALAFQPYFTATAANVGYGWWSHDIGGHMGFEGSPELYVRWAQFGVFSPIFRLHSTKSRSLDRRPWAKPDRYFRAARAAMQLRHALIPYLYSMAWRSHRTGLSLVLPMYYESPDERAAYDAKDQYLFGSELMVAPVTLPGRGERGVATRRVWFPPGTWHDFGTGERYEGGQWRSMGVALEDIPVFARAGAIIPLGPLAGWGGVDNPRDLDIYVFPDPAGGSHTFELYEDDGETTDYLRGKYAITRFTLEGDTFTVHPVEGDASVVPPARTYRIFVRGSFEDGPGTLSLVPVTMGPAEARSFSLTPMPG